MNTAVGEGILDWFKKSHANIGQRELDTLTSQAKTNFEQFMGRNSQTYKDVTWDTLFKYLTIQNQLGLSREQIIKMFSDSEILQKGKQAAQLVGALSPITFDKNIWGTKGKIIGNPIDNKTEKRAEAIVSLFLKLGATIYLNRQTQADEMPDTSVDTTPIDTKTADTAPAVDKDVTSVPSQPDIDKPTLPTTTGNAVRDDRNTAIYNLEMALYKLRGGKE